MTQYTTLINVPSLARELAGGANAPLLFDCRFDLADPLAGARAYAADHLPGARYLHLEHDLSGRPTGANGRHPLPERGALADVLATHGMTADRQVVAYDAQGGIFAARLWWLLRWLGHEAVAVLDGGYEAWRAAGHAVTPASAQVRAGTFEARPSRAACVDLREAEAALATHERLIVDARAPDRYEGRNETLDPVGGHIPGAINRFFKDNLAGDGRFKAASTLREEFAAVLGATPPRSAVMQCGSGVTACHNLLALEIAGLPGAALYPGSWSEWCADPRRPVATGAAP